MKIFLILTMALAVTLVLPSAYSKDQLQEYSQLAKKSYRQGNIKGAIKLLEKSVAIANNKFGKTHDKTLVITQKLAFLYLEMKNTSKAEALVLKIITLKNEPDAMHIKAKYLLAKVKYLKGEYKKSENILKQILRVQQSRYDLEAAKALKRKFGDTLGDRKSDLDASKQELGRFYASRKNLKKAEILFLETVKSSEKNYDRNLALFFNLQALGVFYSGNNQPAKAVKVYERMLIVWTRRSGKQHVTNHSLMLKLANIYYSLKQFNKAENSLLKALKFTERYSDGPFERTGGRKLETTQLLANYYSHRGQYNKALLHYKNALLLAKKILKKSNPVYHHVMTSLASTYVKINDYANAELYFKKSLQLSKEINNKNFTLASKRMLAGLYSTQGFKKKAIIQLREAISLSEKTRGKNDGYTVALKKDLAVLIRVAIKK